MLYESVAFFCFMAEKYSICESHNLSTPLFIHTSAISTYSYSKYSCYEYSSASLLVDMFLFLL